MPIQLIDKTISNIGQQLTAFDTRGYVKSEYNGIYLYNNQVDTFDIITNPLNHFILLIEARGGGKTYSVALAVHYLCSKIPKLKVTIFGPKFGQAKKMLYQITDIDNGSIDKKSSSTTQIIFKNGSRIFADSANEKANIEGEHPDIIIIDERHKCSDFAVSQKIMPMFGTSSKYHQFIEMGVALGKGKFFDDSQNPEFRKIIRNWLECDRLKITGTIKHNGVDYPQLYCKMMPWEKKVEYFGKDAEKMGGRKGSMTLVDWITQYELTWLENIERYLSEAQMNSLKSGAHNELKEYDRSGPFFFGLDTAAGSVNPETMGLDYTALAVWCLRKGDYYKVAAYDWQGDPMEQFDEIKDILKMYNVKQGCVDYSNIGIAFISMLKRNEINCEGIMYKMKDPESKKNLKVAMFENFINTLDINKAKYPKVWSTKKGEEGKILVSETMYKAYIEWTMFERHIKDGKTLELTAPSGEHDDHCNADVLALWSSRRIQKTFDTGWSNFPMIVSSGGFQSK